jgi:hypothetical protein
MKLELQKPKICPARLVYQASLLHKLGTGIRKNLVLVSLELCIKRIRHLFILLDLEVGRLLLIALIRMHIFTCYEYLLYLCISERQAFYLENERSKKYVRKSDTVLLSNLRKTAPSLKFMDLYCNL